MPGRQGLQPPHGIAVVDGLWDAPQVLQKADRLRRATIAYYAAPMLGLGFVFFLTDIYLLKFTTDVLGIAPAAMGVVLLVSRLFDAVTDPLAGFLSDRTRTRLGRRRPWLLAGTLPVSVSFVLLWAPPRSLDPDALVLWMGVTIVLFYVSRTVYAMPLDALGAELSSDYEDRNRLFGARRLAFGIGAISVFAGMHAIVASPDPRSTAASVALLAAVLSAGLMLLPVFGLRERAEYQGRGSQRPLTALADVWRNPHARILLLVYFLQQLGVASVTVMAPFFAQYVLGSADAVTYILGGFFLVSIATIPGWVRLGQHYEKRTLLLSAMAIIGAALLGFAFVGEGMVGVAVAVAACAGAAGGGLDVLFPSLQADVIDTDEHLTGDRKEGVYLAAWHFAAKTAVGISGMFVGFLLSASGFQPNAVQSEQALWTIRLLIGGMPLLCFGAGSLVFLRFRLTKAASAEIRAALDRPTVRTE
jgi:GPH family glycoside/pentoside/hexuronide:cation symporter